jgi:hypothetical protein
MSKTERSVLLGYLFSTQKGVKQNVLFSSITCFLVENEENRTFCFTRLLVFSTKMSKTERSVLLGYLFSTQKGVKQNVLFSSITCFLVENE